MDFKDLLAKRRSIRKFSDRPIPEEVIRHLIDRTLTAPSARNSHSTFLLVVDNPETVTRMAEMRDYGSAFMKGAPVAIVIMGNPAMSNLWEINAAISATILHLAAVDEGLASCWVHIAGRPRLKSMPHGEQAVDYLRTFLPIPEEVEPLCAIVLGYSDFEPKPLPETDNRERVIRLKD